MGCKTDGAVACWGADDRGQASPLGGEFATVSAGQDHACGVKTNGFVACWGFDSWGKNHAARREVHLSQCWWRAHLWGEGGWHCGLLGL